MPKMKSHRGAMKRFKLTANGKIKRNQSHASHMQTGKPSGRKRQLRRAKLVSGSDARRVKRLLRGG